MKYFLLILAFPVCLSAQVMQQQFVNQKVQTVAPSNPSIRCTASYTLNASSYNANFCTGSAAGDIAVIHVGQGFGMTTTLPSGWSPISAPIGSSWYAQGLSKTLTSGDISTGYVTLPFSGSYYGEVEMIVIVGGTNSVGFTRGINGTSPNSVTTPTLTNATDTLLYTWTSRNTASTQSFSRGTGYQSSTIGDTTGALAYEALSSGGAQTVTSTFTGGSNGVLYVTQILNSAPTYTDEFSAPPLTAARNNFTGSMGYSVLAPSAITVYQLGRLYVSGNTGNHTVYIWDTTATSSPVATCTVLAASTSDVNGYKWCSLGSPVTLVSARRYDIAVDETNGGDTWADTNTWRGYWTLNAAFGATSSCFTGTPGGYPGSCTSGDNQGYSTPTFRYQ